MEQLFCTVVSIVPFVISEEKPGLVPCRFFIEASDTIIPQVLHVSNGHHFVYLDESRGNLQVRDSPTEIAKAIVEDYTGSQLRSSENEKPGLFWVMGKKSALEILNQHKDELKSAKDRQTRWFVQLCKQAEDDWNRYHQHNAVSDFQRKVAELIGWKSEEHEWMNAHTVLTANNCPACGSLVRPELVICPQCRCVLNAEKFKSLQFATV